MVIIANNIQEQIPKLQNQNANI